MTANQFSGSTSRDPLTIPDTYTLHQGYTQVYTFGKLQLQLSIAHCTVQEDLANWAGCLQDQREEFSAKNYSQQQVGH